MNGFQQRLILYSSPLFRQCLFQIPKYWVIRSCKRQNLLVSLRSRGKDNSGVVKFHKALAKCCF